MSKKKNITINRRKSRVRYKLGQVRGNRMRLSVFRSNKHISAQIIDDSNHSTLVAVSTLEKDFKLGGNCNAAKEAGILIGKRAKEKKIEKIVFDRGACLYHGRIKAFSEGARSVGLKF